MSLECFYTLPERIEEHRITWRIEPKLCEHVNCLRQKIDPSVELNEEILEAKIARYLFEKLQQQQEDKQLQIHWRAFLTRRCEIVAIQLAHLSPSYFRDLVLMGIQVTIHPVNFFDNFDSQRSRIEYWYPTLKKFSDTKIKHIIIPNFRIITGLQTLGITDLGLVARSSRTRVKEALQHSGYREAELSQYLLIWQCFQEVRNSINRGINNFKLEHFQKISELYREFREELAGTEIRNQDLTGEEIQICLSKIGIAIRQFLDPPIASLDTPLSSQSAEDTTLIENLTYQPRVDEEMNQELAVLRNFISNLIEGLNENEEKQMLFLRYGLELKQAQIAKELGGQTQSTVSRHLQKLQIRIFLQIQEWVRQHLKIEPSSEGLNEIEAVLCQYYSQQIDRFFTRGIQFFGMRSLEVLKLFYIVKLSNPEIANEVSKSEAEVKELLGVMKQWLDSSVTDLIQNEIELKFQPTGAAQQQISKLTETRLETILQLYLQ
ncbi:MAG: hypothetical protein U7123_26845 [Potamolinea sp.]